VAVATLCAAVPLLVSAVRALTPEDALSRLKGLYDAASYERCADEGGSMVRPGQGPEWVGVHEALADCLERRGQAREAVEVLDGILTGPGKDLPPERRAALLLKTGDLLRQHRLLTRALERYRRVADEYGATFPDRFARYADQGSREILATRVATVRARLGEGAVRGAILRLFNGVGESEGSFGGDGRVEVPLFLSSPGTKVAACLLASEHLPLILILPFDGSPQVDLGTLSPGPLPPGKGALAGVVFTPSSGGRRVPRRGIASLAAGHRIALRGPGGPVPLATDGSGAFATPLPPGRYRLSREGFPELELSIIPGESAFVPIPMGGIEVD
jgi:hypothetical protein